MSDVVRYSLAGALAALALTALVALALTTRVQTRLPRSRGGVALTLAWGTLTVAGGIGAVAAFDSRPALAVLAAAAAALAGLAIALFASARGDHRAVVGGGRLLSRAEREARDARRATVAAARLADALPRASGTREIEASLLDAARRLPGHPRTSLVGGHQSGAAVDTVEVPTTLAGERRLRAAWDGPVPVPPAQAAVVLRTLAAQASAAGDVLAARARAGAEERRRDIDVATRSALAAATDEIGALHAVGRVLAERVGATAVELRAVGTRDLVSLALAEPDTPQREYDRRLRAGERFAVSLPQALGDEADLVASLAAAALSEALERIDGRRRIARRGRRQECLRAAARRIGTGHDGGVEVVLDQARRALAAEAAALIGESGPIVRPVGTVDDRVEAELAAAAVHALNGTPSTHTTSHALAAPVVAASGEVIAALAVARAESGDEEDDLDIAAFAQLVATAMSVRGTSADRDRQTRLRASIIDIAGALGDPDDGFAAFTERTREVLDALFTTIVDGDGPVASAPGRSPLVADDGTPSTLLALALGGERLVVCSDVARDRRVPIDERRRLTAAGIRSIVCAPVGSTSAVGVAWPDARTPDDDQVELLRSAASMAASSLQGRELLADERRARTRAEELLRISDLIASSLDEPSMLHEIAAQARALLGTDACVLRLVDGDRLIVRAIDGQVDVLSVGSASPIAAGPTGEVLARRTAMAIENLAGDDRFLPGDPLVTQFKSYLGAPIMAPDADFQGALAVYSARARSWTEDETQSLAAFAGSATVALHNARLYEHVAREKDKSEAIIASTADGMVVVDADERIVTWNRAATAMTGIPPRAAEHRSLPDVLASDLGDREGVAARLLEEAAGEHPAELRLTRGDREIWLSVRSAELRDGDERIGTVYALRDVSEERQLDQLKSDFVATVSHELRTPLTSIYGFAETLLRGDVAFGEDDRRTFLRYISSESERLTRLVDGLLSVARLEAGGISLDLDELDVRDILREIVIREQERVRDSHRIELRVPARPLLVAADRDKLRQIVLNLVDNAIKYSPDGGSIEVSATRHLDAVEIRVSDSGIGISATDQRNLFRKFFRADARMTRGIRGIGLGLYLTRGFVTAMGGRIRVESEEGKGSTFIVELPLRRSTRATKTADVA